MESGSIQNLVILEDTPVVELGLSSVTYSPGKSNEQSQSLAYVVTGLPEPELGSVKYINANNEDVVVKIGERLTLDELHSLQFETRENAVGSTTFTSALKIPAVTVKATIHCRWSSHLISRS